MSHVEFTKWPCCRVEFSGPDPLATRLAAIPHRFSNCRICQSYLERAIPAPHPKSCHISETICASQTRDLPNKRLYFSLSNDIYDSTWRFRRY